MSRATTTFTLLALAGCGGPGTIAVQVLVPDLSGVDTPLPGVVITALPYDRDSILSALEGRAPESWRPGWEWRRIRSEPSSPSSTAPAPSSTWPATRCGPESSGSAPRF